MELEVISLLSTIFSMIILMIPYKTLKPSTLINRAVRSTPEKKYVVNPL